MCDWKVISNGIEILHNEADGSTMDAALKDFINKEIISMSKKDNTEIEIEFTDKIVLMLSWNDYYEEDDDFFILFTPLGDVSYNKEFGFVSEPHDSK